MSSSVTMAADSTQSELKEATKKQKTKAKKDGTRKKKKEGKVKKINKKRKDQDSGGGSDSDSDLDLSKELKPISAYIRDREMTVTHLFSSISGQKMKAMLPEILKPLALDELKRLCLEQLECMSHKRIRRILQGVDPETISSSGTDDDDATTDDENKAPTGAAAGDDSGDDKSDIMADSTSEPTPDKETGKEQEAQVENQSPAMRSEPGSPQSQRSRSRSRSMSRSLSPQQEGWEDEYRDGYSGSDSGAGSPRYHGSSRASSERGEDSEVAEEEDYSDDSEDEDSEVEEVIVEEIYLDEGEDLEEVLRRKKTRFTLTTDDEGQEVVEEVTEDPRSEVTEDQRSEVTEDKQSSKVTEDKQETPAILEGDNKEPVSKSTEDAEKTSSIDMKDEEQKSDDQNNAKTMSGESLEKTDAQVSENADDTGEKEDNAMEDSEAAKEPENTSGEVEKELDPTHTDENSPMDQDEMAPDSGAGVSVVETDKVEAMDTDSNTLKANQSETSVEVGQADVKTSEADDKQDIGHEGMEIKVSEGDVVAPSEGTADQSATVLSSESVMEKDQAEPASQDQTLCPEPDSSLVPVSSDKTSLEPSDAAAGDLGKEQPDDDLEEGEIEDTSSDEEAPCEAPQHSTDEDEKSAVPKDFPKTRKRKSGGKKPKKVKVVKRIIRVVRRKPTGGDTASKFQEMDTSESQEVQSSSTTITNKPASTTSILGTSASKDASKESGKKAQPSSSSAKGKKPRKDPQGSSKGELQEDKNLNKMEILELEMRARAIKAMLRKHDAGADKEAKVKRIKLKRN